MKLLAAILSVLIAAKTFGADYYPSSTRFGQYEANVLQGVVGGIPSRSGGAVIDAATYGFATVASAATNSAAIASALAASSAGDIISLPSGTFSVNTTDLNRLYPDRTIRGAGVDVTILKGMATYVFSIGDGSDWGSAFNPASTITGMTAGSATITVADGSGFPTPANASQYRIARVQLSNEAVTPVASTAGYNFVRAPAVLMVGRSGNTITLSQPLPSNFPNSATANFELGFQLAWHTYGVGVEDLTIDGNDSGGAMAYGIYGTMASNCWVKNVKIIGYNSYGIFNTDWVNGEIREVLIGASLGGGSNKAGLLWNTCSYGLVENNVFLSTYPTIEVNFGSMSNVFGYNFHDGVANINHGAHNSFNLYEGETYWFMQSDGYFGGSSEDTILRNYMRSGITMSLKRFSRNYNIIGSVVGVAGGSYSTDGSEHWGDPNIGNNNSSGTWELSDSSYSLDWDGSQSRIYIWTGTLTTRTSGTTGVITLDSGMITSFNAALANIAGSKRNVSLVNASGTATAAVTNVTGNDVTFTTDNSAYNLPSTSTVMWITGGPEGFQEKDLDVANTTIRKANYYVLTGNIPAGESLGSDTLPSSYYRSAKPDWFGTLAWPPFDSSAPPASDTAGIIATPAGWRFTYGNTNYLNGGTAATVSGTTTVTGTLTPP